ncbi:MAG TPA: matrixin family metalloprotease [Actinomycetota bacterium]|nr:matrixin family metalloprotease [Actinomycetota bacterium]
MVQAPPPLGPQPVPPRPDIGGPGVERASARLFAAFIAASLVAVILGVLAVGAVLRGPSPVEAGAGGPTAAPSATTDSPSPSVSPTARAKVDGAFKFLERVGGVPVRWNPCETISYAVNADGAGSSIKADLHEALARVTRATQIEFVSVGPTEETFLRAYQRMRYKGVIRKAELIIIWVDHGDYQAILRRLDDPRPSIAFAKTMAGLFADQDQYFGGIIVMDAEATSQRGFGHSYAHGSVLLHELGHIMGLDHVKDPDQLMYSGRYPNYGLHDFGTGDLEGLRRIGRDAGCLE